ncbi:MAG: Flp pilus assembly complex ATPase component TadA [Eubacterium sp.]|nr:Flp pilus assembly complex ATPase component TadA [Eubacterium sp.]MCI9411613.1 Flp pilus assembly complex ATPase component TadA [Eubacterium sp.]
MMISQTRKRIGDVLIDANIITQEQLMTALEEQRKTGKRLGEVLVELKYTDETEIAEAMSQQMKIPLAKIREAKLAPEIIELLPENIVRKNNVIPFELDENNPNILRIAMADPLDIIAVDDISIITNMQIDIMVATPSDITYAIEKYYGNEQSAKLAESFAQERMDKNQKLKKEEDGNDEVDNSPIVLLVNKIIEQAVNERASDIHIEALEDQVRVRYRIDGAMQEVMRYPKDLQSAIVARIKIVSGMNISEKRAPQDGRMTLIFNRVEYDLRVSSLPTTFGEKVVMRIASKSGLNKEKSELGFQEEELKRFDGILKNPHGIILVTGPTGSGKSTTLYTVLNELNGGDVNIITVEDPVEADVDGINQVQVNEKAGLTFASALRSILRQDPDIIMIGEIRDEETASIAVKAAITGHLVVSTLHTNSAASTVTRLEDMGIEPYMVADSVVGIIAQRLVRRICPKCHVQKQMTDTDKFRLRLRGDSNPMIYEPSESGCAYCNNSGYRGRIGVYEIMPITPALREVISRGGGAEEIQKVALKEGLTTLRLGAAKLVLKGVTSISEVERIAAE